MITPIAYITIARMKSWVDWLACENPKKIEAKKNKQPEIIAFEVIKAFFDLDILNFPPLLKCCPQI